MNALSRRYSSGGALALILGTGLLPLATAAETSEDFTLSGFAGTGLQYNSNLSVNEIETAAGESDSAFVLDLGVDLAWKPADRLSTDIGYSFSSNDYQNYDSFDLALHMLYADVSYDFDALTLGTSYSLADAELDGDGFLTLEQYSIYAGKLIASQWYLRGSLNFADKSFDRTSTRDANNQGFTSDLYWFSGDAGTSIMAGYTYTDETTRADPFTYQAHTLRVRFTRETSLFGRESRFRIGYRFQNRDYEYITPAIDTQRYDSQQATEASLEISLNPYLDVITAVELSNFSSNLDSADYNDNRITASVRASF